MLFALQPQVAHINDINGELINVYRTIQTDVEHLIATLEKYHNSPEYFYEIRDIDRNRRKYASLSATQKAARLIYLNKTCYNGLFRVNNAGEFNTPFGNYKKPNIVNAPVLRAVHHYFNTIDIQFTSQDYRDILESIEKKYFVYLDPPYDPLSHTANFTGYSKGGFSREDQICLRKYCDALHQRGVRFMLSNADTPFVREQYHHYTIHTVQARRSINSNPRARGEINEVVVMNYDSI